MPISDLHLRWLESRGISPDTATRFGLYTDKGALVYPFVDGGEVVTLKFRGKNKKFWQENIERKTFYNADILDDPAVVSGEQAAVITEGEGDCLATVEAGYPFVVSVPDGAPPDNYKPNEDPDADRAGKFEFMFNNRDRLKKVKRYIIAADNDGPGRRLAEELVRRLGAGRCSFVVYPEGCKDLGEVLQKHGREAVLDVIANAKPYPVRGLYRMSDYPAVEPIKTITTGWPILDDHFGLFEGAFTVVIGIPGHGKTTLAMNLAVHAYRAHGWRTAVFSPEMPCVPHMQSKMRRIVSGLPLHRVMQDRHVLEETDRIIDEAFVWIDEGPDNDLDEDMTLEWLIERLIDAVHRYGIKHALIDPWNEIEHLKAPHESLAEYQARAIKTIKRFAKQYRVACTVIVHPTKAIAGEKPREPNLYDADGSAHWFNKPDFGLVVLRENEQDAPDITTIRIVKVRFKDTGRRGSVLLRYVDDSETFEQLDPDYAFPWQRDAAE